MFDLVGSTSATQLEGVPAGLLELGVAAEPGVTFWRRSGGGEMSRLRDEEDESFTRFEECSGDDIFGVFRALEDVGIFFAGRKVVV